jgi:hypothetical protein
MRVELGFDNSLCLVDIERLELRITGFTDADYGNVLRYDPEITFWHEHRWQNPAHSSPEKRYRSIVGQKTARPRLGSVTISGG